MSEKTTLELVSDFKTGSHSKALQAGREIARRALREVVASQSNPRLWEQLYCSLMIWKQKHLIS